MKTIAKLACVAVALAATGALAQTGTAPANDAPNVTAKISMSAAVATAEQHHQGRAVRAEYEKQKDGNWVYDVEVKAAGGVFDVKVDPEKGTVLASNPDKADADDNDAND